MQTYLIRCSYRSTAVTIKVDAETAEDAIRIAHRDPIGGRAMDFSVVGQRPIDRPVLVKRAAQSVN